MYDCLYIYYNRCKLHERKKWQKVIIIKFYFVNILYIIIFIVLYSLQIIRS